MTSFAQRVEAVRDFLDSIGKLDFDRAATLLADDAVMTLPFLDGLPPTAGRAAIIEQLGASVPQLFKRMTFFYDAFYEVRDSDTVIAEYHSECPRTRDAGVYRNTYITVFGFDGEKIALYKEYLNPARLAELA
ncbi:MAG: nuclear transport factor 2 family protein [Mycobacterium sp.]